MQKNSDASGKVCTPAIVVNGIHMRSFGSEGSGLHTKSTDLFEIRSVQPVDMFPHTVHVETVVWLERLHRN